MSEHGSARDQAQAVMDEIALTKSGVIRSGRPAATEDLEPAKIGILHDTVRRFWRRAGGGQLPPVQETEEEGALPGPLYDAVVSIAGFVQEAAGLSEHAFDPNKFVTTNEGVLDLAMRLDQILADEDFQAALSVPSKTTAAATKQPPATQTTGKARLAAALEENP